MQKKDQGCSASSPTAERAALVHLLDIQHIQASEQELVSLAKTLKRLSPATEICLEATS